MNTNRLNHFLMGLIFSSLLICQPARAHDLWITMAPYQIGNGHSVTVSAYSSHHFPAPEADILAPERTDKIYFITPSGRQIPATQNKGGIFESQAPFKENGTYLAVGIPVNGFATKTPEGYQRDKNKKDVTDAIQCRFSQKFAKAVFTNGKGGGDAFSIPLGHAMEIIPMTDPSLLRTGDTLPVKILLDGQPTVTFVFGTYAGFSESANTFAYTTRTDKDGIARIKVIHDGAWLLIAKQEEAYPDAAECDVKSRAASLTFEIR